MTDEQIIELAKQVTGWTTHFAIPSEPLGHFYAGHHHQAAVDSILRFARALLASKPAAPSAVALDDERAPSLPPLPDPVRTFADHSDRAYSRQQMIDYARAASPQPVEQTRALTDWQDRCAALVDIYDDALNNAPEDRCYVDGAFKAEIDEVRALLTAAQPASGGK